MAAAIDALFVLTVLGLAVPVAGHLPLRPRVLLVFWLLALGVLAAAGVFVRDDRVPLYFAGVGPLPSAAGVALVCSRAGTALLQRTSAVWLVGAQSFRVIVEIVLWALALQHRLSPLLTFEGRNFALRTEPPTTIIATWPYIWLPGFLVPLALSLHVASLRTLGAGGAPTKEAR